VKRLLPILSVAAATSLQSCGRFATLPPPELAPTTGHEAAKILPGAPALDDDDSVADSTIPARYQEIRAPKLAWKAPLLSSFADTLAPGAVVYWVPDSSLPLASIQIVWPEGRLALGPRDDAAASLLGGLLRRGGAGAYSAAKLDDTLEFLAAHASVSVGMVRSSASIGGLSRDLPFLISLLGDILTTPRFDTARISTAVEEKIQDIEHEMDTPPQTMGLAWDRISYGASAWTHLTDSADVRGLKADNFRRVLAGRFSGSRVWISVAGRFDKASTRQQIMALLERLRRGPAAKAPVARLDSLAPVPDMPGRGVWLYDVPASQTQIRVGARFLRRDNPDYYPLMLASEVLGQGGFGSRLVDRIRSDEGLTYHVSSFVGSDYDRPAMLGVELQTKVQSTGRALKLVFEEITRLRDSGFRAGELSKAREGLAASVPSMFDSPEATADLVLESSAWGRRDDHFARYLRALDTIPDTTVLRVYRKWFVPDSMRVVICGPADVLSKPFADGSPALSTYGPVTVWNADTLHRR
jgi:zinc protease